MWCLDDNQEVEPCSQDAEITESQVETAGENTLATAIVEKKELCPTCYLTLSIKTFQMIDDISEVVAAHAGHALSVHPMASELVKQRYKVTYMLSCGCGSLNVTRTASASEVEDPVPAL